MTGRDDPYAIYYYGKTWQDIIESENFEKAFVQTLVDTGMAEYPTSVCYACFQNELYWFQQKSIDLHI